MKERAQKENIATDEQMNCPSITVCESVAYFSANSRNPLLIKQKQPTKT